MSTNTQEDPDLAMNDAFTKVRRRIRENFPKDRVALRWKKITERIIRSQCDRFQVERRGEGDAVRYFAFILPDRVIGHRLLSAAQAKEVCERHAMPLPPPSEPATPDGAILSPLEPT